MNAMHDERSFFDHVLSTTRSIRWRLDLERPVDREILIECIRLENKSAALREMKAPDARLFILPHHTSADAPRPRRSSTGSRR